MKNRFAKMTLALLLSLAMIVGLVPTSSAADAPSELTENTAQLEEVAPETVALEDTTTVLEPVANSVPVEEEVAADARIASALNVGARAEGDGATQIAKLTLSLGELDYGNPEILFPDRASVQATATSSSGFVEEGAVNVASELDWGTGGYPQVPGNYRVTMTLQANEGYEFNSSIRTGISVSTREHRENGVVLVEGLTANTNDLNVIWSAREPQVLTLQATFTIKNQIKSVEVYVPAPVEGANVANYGSPSQVTARDTRGLPVSGLTASLTWDYRRIITTTTVDEHGFQIPGTGSQTRVSEQTRYTQAQFRSFTESYGPLNTDTGRRTKTVERYVYYPILLLGPAAGTRFSPDIGEDDVSFKAASSNAEISVVVSWDTSEGRIVVHPTDYTPQPEAQITEWFEKNWIITASSNSITNVTLNIPYSSTTQLQEGTRAPSASELMRNMSAWYGEKQQYLRLPLASAEWVSGVADNGSFNTEGGVAVMHVRVNSIDGFTYGTSGTGVQVSFADGGATIVFPTGDYWLTAVPQSGENFIELDVPIRISPASITEIGDFGIKQGTADAPVIGQTVATGFQTTRIPFTYPTNATGEFTPYVTGDTFDGNAKSQVTIVGINGTTLGSTIDFDDELEIAVRLSRASVCGFPVVYEAPSENAANGEPLWVAPELKLPEGWYVKWFDDTGEKTSGLQSEIRPGNSTDVITIYKRVKMASLISGLDVELDDLIVGTPLSEVVYVTGKDRNGNDIAGEEAVLGTIAWEDNDAAAVQSDPEQTLYGDSFKGTLTITSSDAAQYVFDEISRSDLSSKLNIKWDHRRQGALTTLTADVIDFKTSKGADEATLTFTFEIPRGVISGMAVASSQMQLIVDDPLDTLGSERGNEVAVSLNGYVAGEPDNAASAGIFGGDNAGALKWTIIDGTAEEKVNKFAVAGREYGGRLTFTVDDIGTRYELVPQSELNIGIRSSYSDNGAPFRAEYTEGSGQTRVAVTPLLTKAKLPIDAARLNIAPPPQGVLSALRDGSISVERTVELEAAQSANVRPPQAELEFSNWELGSSSTGGYGVTMTVRLTEDTYDNYVFRFRDDGKQFTADNVAVNVGRALTDPPVFEVVDEEMEDSSNHALEAGRQFMWYNYIIPDAKVITSVDVDIVPRAASPTVSYRLSPDAADGYNLDVTTETLQYNPATGVYTGTVRLSAEETTGPMDGGYVFRNTDGTPWSSADYTERIKITGLNDANEGSGSRVTIYDPTNGLVPEVHDKNIVLPFRVTLASEDITRVALTVPQPYYGMEPDDQFAAESARTTRYRVPQYGTQWRRASDEVNANGLYEGPYIATITVAANHNLGVDDGYFFESEDWPERTPEELAEYVKLNTYIEGGARPISARVDQAGNLIIEAEVDQRKADNEINLLRLNLAAPSLSELIPGVCEATYVRVLEADPETGEPTNPEGTPFENTDEIMSKILDYVRFGNWTRVNGNIWSVDVTVKPKADYNFYNVTDTERVRLETPPYSAPRFEIQPNGAMRFTIQMERVNDLSLTVNQIPAAGGSLTANTALYAIEPGGKETLTAVPAQGYSLYGDLRDFASRDNRLQIPESDIRASDGGFRYTINATGDISPSKPASLTVRFLPNSITLLRSGMTVTVNGQDYIAGTPVIAGSEVTVQVDNGYSLRPGRTLTMYNVLTDAAQELTSADGNVTFTFTMPNYPVEIDGRVVRPGDPDPDPTPRPTRSPAPSASDEPGGDDPTASPSASGRPSSPVWPTVTASPTHNPSSQPTASGTDGPFASDDYLKDGSFDMLEKTSNAQIEVSGSGSARVAKGFEVTSGTSALVRDLVGQYKLPDGLDIQVVDKNGKILRSSDKVGTGHRMQLINNRKHVLDQATLCVKGDVTGSGVIGITQLVRLAKAVTYESPLEEPYFSAGDLNGNGRIDLGDMVQLAGRLAKR